MMILVDQYIVVKGKSIHIKVFHHTFETCYLINSFPFPKRKHYGKLIESLMLHNFYTQRKASHLLAFTFGYTAAKQTFYRTS